MLHQTNKHKDAFVNVLGWQTSLYKENKTMIETKEYGNLSITNQGMCKYPSCIIENVVDLIVVRPNQITDINQNFMAKFIIQDSLTFQTNNVS